MRGERVLSLVLKVISFKLFLDTVPSSTADNVTASILWMFSWSMTTRAKSLVLTTTVQSASHRIGYV